MRGDDVFGFVRPALDAHTLGLSSVARLLRDCGLVTVMADASICSAADAPRKLNNMALLARWIRRNGVTRFGFSYRLDPRDGADRFLHLWRQFRLQRLFSEQGGPVRAAYFAGLPEACRRINRELGGLAPVFMGDETPVETLDKLGVPRTIQPAYLREENAYDQARLQFGRRLLATGAHFRERPVDRADVPGFGTLRERLVDRLRQSRERGLPPLMRAHVGPYLSNRREAVRRFLDWTRRLAESGFLDILSIGTSQLTQARFGEDWGDAPNGGGVPLNSPEEFRQVWTAARPMLVRTYAGTARMPELARMYEETINIAWHTFSLWWFCQLDGRGPLPLRDSLEMHLKTLRVVSEFGKPYEPNVPHHFAFRGADDVTYVVSAVLAARTAKQFGIRHLVLQNMLNTPRSTSGLQDLAKSRALLTLVRELEDEGFRVCLQPRAGLALFSPDLEKAKVQLAAVTALMDDIEPHDAHSPPLIHVVSYSEGARLADPPVVTESIQITLAALREYRRLRAAGQVNDMSRSPEVNQRTAELLRDARAVLRAIDESVPNVCSVEGLYRVFAAGFLPVPDLWACRDEFPRAVQWRTNVVRGSVKVVDENDQPVPAAERAQDIAEELRAEGFDRRATR